MAYWINNAINFKSKNRKGFLCDSASDLQDLPTTTTYGKEQDGKNVINQPVEMGSVAYVIDTQKRYCLNSRDVWVEIQYQ